MHLRAIFATHLRLLRNEKGLSQEELADLAGIDRNQPTNFETEKTSATLDTVDKIAAALGVPAWRLLDERLLPGRGVDDDQSV